MLLFHPLPLLSRLNASHLYPHFSLSLCSGILSKLYALYPFLLYINRKRSFYQSVRHFIKNYSLTSPYDIAAPSLDGIRRMNLLYNSSHNNLEQS